MPIRSIPFVLAAALSFSAAAPAQSTLPATAPTNLSSPITATSDTIKPGPKQHRAQVTFINGQLQIRADNSSLNLILREISRQTGMTITGGVADERVFGNYGPADPGTILATLLNGTGSNLLLQANNADNIPTKLILTPRTGGATPPNPNAPSFDEEARSLEEAPAPQPAQQLPQPGPRKFAQQGSEQEGSQQQGSQQQGSAPNNTQLPGVPAAQQPTSGPPSMPQPLNNVNGNENNTSPSASTYPTTNSVPLDSLPTPSTTPVSAGIVDAPNPPPAGSTTPAAATQDTTSPKAPPTPEDIFRQLQALHSQGAQTGTSTPSTTPPQTTTPQQ